MYDGVGKFQGDTLLTSTPLFHTVTNAPRRMPTSLMEDIDNELDDIVKNDILVKNYYGDTTHGWA